MQISPSGWRVRAISDTVPSALAPALSRGIDASVPSVVHTDLLAAGLIADPFIDDAESQLRWIGETDWEYSAVFDWQGGAGDRVDLAALGLDTVADLTLNGRPLGRTANQHRSYRFDIASLLRHGENELRIVFTAPRRYAREQEALLGSLPHPYASPYNAMRKSACNFGWDWGPDLATAGIWKDLRIESWSGVRLAAVRPIADAQNGIPTIIVHIDLEWQPGVVQPAQLRLRLGEREASTVVAAGTTSTSIRLDAEGLALWWPRGHGEQIRHRLEAQLGAQPQPWQRWSGLVGFRHVELDLAPDADGHPFGFVVNGERVYVRGANWIPDDVFPSRVTRESLSASIRDATEAGMNLLRVWGGGIYESDDFYDLCDEAGPLVWQDFLFACAAYSEAPELADEVGREAEEAIRRLVAHPSLVLLNGNNESTWGYVDWGWREQLAGRAWGEGYYLRMLPELVARLAPNVPYTPASPFSDSRYLHPNDPSNGTMHIWDVWNSVDYDVYRQYRPRFVAEFGFQGPPAWSTLLRAVHDEPMDPFGANMLVHQKADDGNGKLERGLGSHLPLPRGFDDWHWATQLNQARAVVAGIEHFRSLHPLNQGAIVWQLNDCWPAISWAAVDGDRHRKPLWYGLRQVYADVLVTLQRRGDGVVVAVHNDRGAALTARLRLRRLAFDGTELAVAEADIEVDARTLAEHEVPSELALAGDPRRELLVAQLSTGQRGLWYFEEDTGLALRADAVNAQAVAEPGGVAVLVRARALVKDAVLLVDRVDAGASVDSGLITLLPGEEHVFHVTAAEGDPLRFLSSGVLRTANDLIDTRLSG